MSYLSDSRKVICVAFFCTGLMCITAYMYIDTVNMMLQPVFSSFQTIEPSQKSVLYTVEPALKVEENVETIYTSRPTTSLVTSSKRVTINRPLANSNTKVDKTYVGLKTPNIPSKTDKFDPKLKDVTKMRDSVKDKVSPQNGVHQKGGSSLSVVVQGGAGNKTALKLMQVKEYDWLSSLDKTYLKAHASTVNTATTDTLHLDSLPYLENYHNPCWIEKLPSATNPYTKRGHSFEMMAFQPGRLRVQHEFPARRAAGKPYRMRCLPHYYIIGPQKSGTTDLYKSLVMHPHVKEGMAKEPHWWARSRLAGTTLEEYIDLFDQAAETIAGHVVNGTDFHPYITGDATPELIWDNWLWSGQPENKVNGSVDIHYITANHIHHVNPQAKIISMLRDPINRLWSDYNYFGHSWPNSPQDFDHRVQRGLKWLRDCMSNVHTSADRRHCMYDRLEKYGSKYGGAWNPVVRLRMGMYSELLTDWYEIFPSEQILILRMEDYAEDRMSVLNRLYEFLELDPLPENIAKSLKNKSVANAVSKSKYQKTGSMLDSTRRDIKAFYKIYNERLARLTENADFLLWNL